MRQIEKCAMGAVLALLAALLAALSPAAGQSWSVSQPDAKTGNIYAASGDTPVVLQQADVGSDDYLVTGQLLLAQPKASVQIGLGKAEMKRTGGGAIPGKISCGADTLNIAGSYKAYPGVQESWIDFSLNVAGATAVVQVMVPDLKMSPLEVVPATRRSPWIVLQGAMVRNLSVKTLPNALGLALPVSIDHAVNVRLIGDDAGVKLDPASLPHGVQVIDGMPFCFADSENGQAIDVLKAKQVVRKGPITEEVRKENPPCTYAELGYSLEVPGDQYSAVHLIAFSTRRPETAARVDVRVGFRGFAPRTADEWVDQAIDVPYLDDARSEKVVSSIPVKLADGSQGYLHHLRAAMPQTGQLREFSPLVVQFTRKVEVKPDEFLKRFVEPDSAAVILAVTMERSPLEISYTADQPCNLFSEGQRAIFNLKLTNRSGRKVSARAYATSSGPGLPKERNARRAEWTVEQSVALLPGQSKTVPLDATPKARGWYTCVLGVEADGRLQQRRDTTFVYLAPDTRKAREDSPFGIWCYWNSHTVIDIEGRIEKFFNIMNKGGWRWTLGGPGGGYLSAEDSAKRKEKGGQTIEDQAAIHRSMAEKYKIKVTFAKPPLKHFPVQDKEKGAYNGPFFDQEFFQTKVLPYIDWAKNVGLDNAYFILHESRFEGDAILMHFNELLGGAPYPWKPETKALFQQQLQNARDYGRAIKQAVPDAKVVMFNDGVQFVMEHLKAGFPADAFDVIGLEMYGYHYLPESQPGWLNVLADLQIAKIMQAKYGYHKPVWLTEALYHSTRPGEMWMHEQAVIMVREAMICLACGVQRMCSSNTTNDCANPYGKSLWGQAGVCFREPEYNPKTSFAMVAWLTQVLDQARYAGKLAHDSTSLHVLDFQKADGSHVYPLWVVSGKQKVTLNVQDDKAVVYDCYGNTTPAPAKDGQLVVEVTDTPVYVTGTVVTAVAGHQGIELVPPAGREVATFASAGPFARTDTADTCPKAFNMLPVVRGNYRADIADVDGKPALRIELLDDDDPRKLVARYGEFQLSRPMPLPGRPFALNVRAKGNGGWGKLVLELTDAKGKKFTSFPDGAAANRGLPYFTFDGWQTMPIPLPGRFQADASLKWPANRDWHDAGEVTYPLSLTKIIVLMRPHILYVDEQRNVENRLVYLEGLSVTEAPEGM
ncbi:MAG TPA: hypothetical protein VMY42_07135 [Thermoguttaceae bacterium]|nr:hypothetical protein [Thermoguttaceae bacterium]